MAGIDSGRSEDEPSSPSRSAAKGAAGWQRFHGKTGGRSVSVTLTKEEAELIRQRRRCSKPESPGGAISNGNESSAQSEHKFSFTSGTTISWHNPTYMPSPVARREASSRLEEVRSEDNVSEECRQESKRVEELSKLFRGKENHPGQVVTSTPPVMKRLWKEETEPVISSARNSSLSSNASKTSSAEPSSAVGDESPPPLPPKPKQKISMIGSPNSDQFIVMDNSSYFASTVNTSLSSNGASSPHNSSLSPPAPAPPPYTSKPVLTSPVVAITPSQPVQSAGAETGVPVRLTEVNLLSAPALPEPHSRSDSGLSSLGSWTGQTSTGGSTSSSGTRSGTSSVRSSSIVSNSSSKLDELFAGQKRSSSIVSSCSMKLEEFDELEEEGNIRSNNEDDLQLPSLAGMSCTSVETGVQRQLATVKDQKEKLIKEIVENEQVGMDIQSRLEKNLSVRDMEKYTVYLEEMEKVVLLLLSLSSRLERAEEELACGNLTDCEKEGIRRKRDKLTVQLQEAHTLKDMSDRRKQRVESIIENQLGQQLLESFRGYIGKREELLRTQRACEEAERSILPVL